MVAGGEVRVASGEVLGLPGGPAGDGEVDAGAAVCAGGVEEDGVVHGLHVAIHKRRQRRQLPGAALAVLLRLRRLLPMQGLALHGGARGRRRGGREQLHESSPVLTSYGDHVQAGLLVGARPALAMGLDGTVVAGQPLRLVVHHVGALHDLVMLGQ